MKRAPIPLLVALSATATLACCGVQQPHLQIGLADQEILVSWNPETRLETFVRRANFRTDGAHFGFLVPTPTQPKLAAAPNEVFDRLRPLLEPKRVYEHEYRPYLLPAVLYPFAFLSATGSRSGAPMLTAPASAVRVLDQQRVAGYDATVLEADNTEALSKWLAQHRYAVTAPIREWLEPYVARKWKITAFKYVTDPKARSPGASTEAISMTFETARPLFPYRVPTSQLAQPGDPTTLRVYYAGRERARGQLGDAGRPWRAQLKFAMEVPDLAERLAGAVPSGNGTWLTAFEDRPWPSGTQDLYFDAAPDPAPYQQVERIVSVSYVPVPPDILLALIFFGVRAFRQRPR